MSKPASGHGALPELLGGDVLREPAALGAVPAGRQALPPQARSPQPRRFYRLTAKGKRASVVEWSDPLQALYHYPKEQRSSKKAERKVYKPGSLPRLPSTRKK